MYKKIVLSLLVLLLSLLAFTIASEPGCPSEAKPVENFDVTGLAKGIWHEVARYPFEVETDLTCVSYDLTLLENGILSERVNVLRSSSDFVRAKGIFFSEDKTIGFLNATISSGANPNKLLQLPAYVVFQEDKYVVAYSCNYYKDVKQEYAWIISRDLKQSDELEEARSIIKSLGYLDINKFLWIDNSECIADE